jgi:hypothetical protein
MTWDRSKIRGRVVRQPLRGEWLANVPMYRSRHGPVGFVAPHDLGLSPQVTRRELGMPCRRVQAVSETVGEAI